MEIHHLSFLKSLLPLLQIIVISDLDQIVQNSSHVNLPAVELGKYYELSHASIYRKVKRGKKAKT